MTTRTKSVAGFRLADLVIDLRRRCVTRNQREIALGKLTFDLLVALAESWPEVVTQDALAQRVWGGRVATPETVAQRVKILRRALGDDARSPRYLRVLRGHGYQLIPDAEAIVDAGRDDPRTSIPATGRRSGWLWLPAAAAAAAVIAALAGWAYLAGLPGGSADSTSARPASPPHTIAVIPFRNVADATDEYFVDGLSAALMSRLARYDDIRVLGSDSSYLLKQSAEDYRGVAQRLGVEYLLSGTVRKAGEQLDVFAELVSTDDGYVVWNGTFNRPITEIFATHDEISQRAVEALGLPSGLEQYGAPAGGTANLAAYDHFLKGRYLLMRYEQLDAALAELGEAVRLDPDFGLAYGVLAHSWRDVALEDAGRVGEALEQSRAAALLALEKAPGSYIAHAVMAEQHALDHRWIEAHAAMRRSTELYGGTGDGEILFLLAAGQAKEALPAIRSFAAAEPLLIFPQHWFAMAYDMLGDHSQAVAHYEAAKRLPGEHWPAEHVQFMRQLARGELAEPLALLQANSPFGSHFAALDGLDDREAVRAALRAAFAQNEGWSVADFARFSAWASFVGDPALAIDSMRATLRLTPWFLPLVWLPVWQPTRTEPAFKAFMIEVGLPEYWRSHGWPEHCRPIGDDDFECA